MNPLASLLLVVLAWPGFAPGAGETPALAPPSGAPQAPPVGRPAEKPADSPEEKPADKPAPVAANPDVSAVLDGIQRFYADAQDLRADFAQTYTYKVYNRTQRSSGQVFFKKPKMMRWDYKKPVAKVFVADGQTLWVYEPEENQVFKRDLSSSQLPVALTFMSGEGRLADEFDARLMQSPADSYVVELIPKRHAGDYRSLLLTVDRETFAVKASTVVDPVGNSNQVTFANVRINSGLPDGAFRFSPPKGVRVITDP